MTGQITQIKRAKNRRGDIGDRACDGLQQKPATDGRTEWQHSGGQMDGSPPVRSHWVLMSGS